MESGEGEGESKNRVGMVCLKRIDGVCEAVFDTKRNGLSFWFNEKRVFFRFSKEDNLIC